MTKQENHEQTRITMKNQWSCFPSLERWSLSVCIPPLEEGVVSIAICFHFWREVERALPASFSLERALLSAVFSPWGGQSPALLHSSSREGMSEYCHLPSNSGERWILTVCIHPLQTGAVSIAICCHMLLLMEIGGESCPLPFSPLAERGPCPLAFLL